MGGSSTINNSETRIEALKLQSSAYGVTVPVVGGTTRIPGNLVYYTDFKAIPHTQQTSTGGKGGGVKTQNTTYTYSASVIMGLCHGQIQDIKSIWVGKKRYDASWFQPPTRKVREEFTLFSAGSGYQVLQGSKFAGVVAVVGSEYGSGAEGFDFVVGPGGFITFRGGFDPSIQNQFMAVDYMVNDSGYTQSAAAQLGVSLAYGGPGQAAPGWVQALHPSEALTYPYQAYVHAQDYQLGSGAQVENHTFEVVGFGAYAVSPAIPDCNPADFTRSVLLDGRYGARLPSQTLGSLQAWSDYCLAAGLLLSPALTTQQKAAEFVSTMALLTNTAPVWSSNVLKMIPYGDQALNANGASYVPNLTPIYDLTDDHFLVRDGDPPIRVSRNSPAERFNNVKLQYQSRASGYNNDVAEVKDDADIQANGLRTMGDVAGADWICDAGVARTVAQLLMQRSLNVTATYEFRLPWAFCLLEPMDLVTVTDTDLGFNKLVVRITDIEEDEDGALTVKAEDFKQGVSSSALYPLQAGVGFQTNFNAKPQSAASVAIFEAPSDLTDNGLGVYAAACGSIGANWGGCNVWVSVDAGVNYKRIGTIFGGARIGRLQSDLAIGDTSAQVAWDGAGGSVVSASAATAALNQSLLWIDGPQGGEYVNFTTATLIAANVYTLSGLIRGAYANPQAQHGRNSRVVRLDEAVVSSGHLDLSFIGSTLNFKFTSFNVYGAAEESLAEVAAYAYTISGGQAKLPPSTPTGLQVAGDRLLWHGVTDPDLAGYRLRLQVGSNRDWGTAAPLHDGLVTTNTFILVHRPAGVTTFMCKAVDSLGNESTAAATAITNLGDLLQENVYEYWNQGAAYSSYPEGLWATPGSARTNCSVQAGVTINGVLPPYVLQADSATIYYPADTSALFWSPTSPTFWPAQVWAEMSYEFDVGTTVDGTLQLDTASGGSIPLVQGEAVFFSYQRGNQGQYWPANSLQLAWAADLASVFWPVAAGWQGFAGGVDVLRNETVRFRMTIKGGATRGIVGSLLASMDVPDVVESGGPLTISPGGSRILPSRSFRAIKSVNCTILNSGTIGSATAISVVIVDKLASPGPLVKCVDSTGTPRLATIDYTLQGY